MNHTFSLVVEIAEAPLFKAFIVSSLSLISPPQMTGRRAVSQI